MDFAEYILFGLSTKDENDNKIGKNKIEEILENKKKINFLKFYQKNEENDENNYMSCKVPKNQLPLDLQHLLKGRSFKVSEEYDLSIIPPWLNMDMILKGQKFANDYFFGVNYAQLLGLVILLSTPDGIDPLIVTGKSHTPSLAYKRYLSTTIIVKSWYESEFWKPRAEGYKNIIKVRSLHSNVCKTMKSNSKIIKELKNQKLNETKLMCPFVNSLSSKNSTNDENLKNNFFKIKNENRIYLNQFEMTGTLFGFFGLVLLYPEKFAASNAKKDELEAFVHLWRYIGYMLGIDDEYNICNGSLTDVIKTCENFVEYFAIPWIMNISKNWEHMSRCAILGINKFTDLIYFEPSLLYLYDLFNIEIISNNINNNSSSIIGVKEVLGFKLMKIFMCKASKIPGLISLINYITKRKIEAANLLRK